MLESGHSYWVEGLAVYDVFPDLGRYPRFFNLLKYLWRSAESVEAVLAGAEPGDDDVLRKETFYTKAAINAEAGLLLGVTEDPENMKGIA